MALARLVSTGLITALGGSGTVVSSESNGDSDLDSGRRFGVVRVLSRFTIFSAATGRTGFGGDALTWRGVTGTKDRRDGRTSRLTSGSLRGMGVAATWSSGEGTKIALEQLSFA